MAKTCPGCGYGPIGPFIDNCPMCAESVRHVPSDRVRRLAREANPPPLWLWWIIGGLVVAVLSVVGFCGFVGLRHLGTAIQDAEQGLIQARDEVEADRRGRTVRTSAAALIREFQEDPQAADQKYAGKYLELTGVVERTGRNRDGTPFVILHAGDENAKVKIECFFDLVELADDAQVLGLGQGHKVTVQGEYDGQVSNIQVGDCMLIK